MIPLIGFQIEYINYSDLLYNVRSVTHLTTLYIIGRYYPTSHSFYFTFLLFDIKKYAYFIIFITGFHCFQYLLSLNYNIIYYHNKTYVILVKLCMYSIICDKLTAHLLTHVSAIFLVGIYWFPVLFLWSYTDLPRLIACAITTNTFKKMLSILPKKCKILNVYKELKKIQNIFQNFKNKRLIKNSIQTRSNYYQKSPLKLKAFFRLLIVLHAPIIVHIKLNCDVIIFICATKNEHHKIQTNYKKKTNKKIIYYDNLATVYSVPKLDLFTFLSHVTKNVDPIYFHSAKR
ncbi:hypothetical protein AGLY_003520 [Aphis glycines]|uniref:Uncharacterized protein n=1 Tax=Aphis glycines TaxID=307491 RepID=A0A6G0U0D1_APHGL|nr:hypothetical protein AGLY_003520 [Aphis glycines]